MKLLTWMHRKFRQGSSETLKEFPLGQPLLDDHHVYQKQNYCSGTLRQMQRDGQARKSFTSLETPRLSDLEENTSAEFSEFFEGFLAIGTLGTDAMMVEPETPTFAVSFEKLTERETEVTENELRLINDELEKVLAVEPKDDCWTDSSGRNSHVSNGRISHASTITLSGKPLEISESTPNGTIICPLQGYLLGSAVELPEKATVSKKENRMSLGELFERHKAEEISEAKCKRGDKREEKEGDKTAINLMKKILKKKIAHTSSRSSSTTTTTTTTTRGTTESASAETKLCKLLHKFHKKVHPECLTSTQRSSKSHKIPCNVDYYKEEHSLPDESITTSTKRALRNSHMRLKKSGSNPTQFIVGGCESNGNRECWIKTDADYLVLEL